MKRGELRELLSKLVDENRAEKKNQTWGLSNAVTAIEIAAVRQ